MKQSFKELQVGQELIVKINPKNIIASNFSKPHYSYDSLLSYGYARDTRRTLYLPDGVIIRVADKNEKSKSVVLETQQECILVDEYLEPKAILPKNSKFNCIFISTLRKCTTEYGAEMAKPDLIQYKVFLDGKPIKPKYYDDMGKIKAALLVMFSYHDKFYTDSQKYVERNPELEESSSPEWITYSDTKLDEVSVKNAEIMMYTNHKNPIRVDFSVEDYFNEIKQLSTVTYMFGAAAREVFKNALKTKEYSHILVYVPDEYRNPTIRNRSYFDYTSLKESSKIKDIIKELGLKNIKKSTKHGKTAIAVKSIDDIGLLTTKLNKGEYFILDCEGDELIEQNERFIKLKLLGF